MLVLAFRAFREHQTPLVVPRVQLMSLHSVLTCQYEIFIRAFTQLEWGLLVSLYKIGT
jgi:hypothetical protein